MGPLLASVPRTHQCPQMQSTGTALGAGFGFTTQSFPKMSVHISAAPLLPQAGRA